MTQLVALSPAEVPVVQTDLIDYCQRKIIAISHDLAEARHNVEIAKKAGWKFASYARAATKFRQRMVYFTKIRDAVKAGYLVVPNFPVEVMAVRVGGEKPPRKAVSGLNYAGVPATTANVTPELLPPGEGHYVDGVNYTRHMPYQVVEGGNTVTRHAYEATEYDDPDFPVRLIKPVVLEATQRAMALKLFDRIGVVTGRKQDPIVIGEIFDPRDSNRWLGSANRKRVSFFIAWWLDPEVL